MKYELEVEIDEEGLNALNTFVMERYDLSLSKPELLLLYKDYLYDLTESNEVIYKLLWRTDGFIDAIINDVYGEQNA